MSDRSRTQASLNALRQRWLETGLVPEVSPEPFLAVSLLTDFGHSDEFVGVLHAVLGCLAPKTPVIDVSHDLPAFDVRAAGRALARATPYLPAGVVMAVVDPGVGTDRAALVVQVSQCDVIFVGPDNGVLNDALAVAGGVSRAIRVAEEKFRLESAGATFDGRDLFAPVAAFLALGGDVRDLGDQIDAAEMQKLPSPSAVLRREKEALVCEVTWVDHFGNSQLSAGGEMVQWAQCIVELPSGQTIESQVFASYEQIPADQVGLVVDSQGQVALCVNRGSASARLRLSEGELVRLVPRH